MNKSKDLNDLIYGQGEWSNMQEIVRRTFRDILESQSSLQDRLTATNRVLAATTSNDQLHDIIESKVRKVVKDIISKELDELRRSSSEMRIDLQRKASIKLVDEIASKKQNKLDDSSLNRITTPHHDIANQWPNEISAIRQELAGMRLKTESLAAETREQNSSMRCLVSARVADIDLIKAQVCDIQEQLSTCVQTSVLHKMSDERITKHDNALSTEARTDLALLQAKCQLLEDRIAKQERTLTTLRLTRGDSREEQVAWIDESHAADLPRGRIEGVLESLSLKVHKLLKDQQSLCDDQSKTQKRLVSVEQVLPSLAVAHQMETLALVVEDQRLRVDSIIAGTTDLPSVSRALATIKDRVQALDSHLKSSDDHLRSVSSQVTDLAGKQSAMQAAVTAVESEQAVGRARLDELQRHSLSVKTLASKLRELSRQMTESHSPALAAERLGTVEQVLEAVVARTKRVSQDIKSLRKKLELDELFLAGPASDRQRESRNRNY